MRKKLQYLTLVAMVMTLLCSCHSHQKIVYIQNADQQETYQQTTSYEARIAPDDQLSILVTCSDLLLAVPFNLQRPQAPLSEGGSTNTNYQDNDNLYYHVDAQGCIQFPTMGTLKVEGMTRSELSARLTDYLINSGYIQDPLVNVSFVGAHYSVLGEVNQPGRYQMSHERVTVLEALAAAGDMTIFGERDKVRLVRRGQQQEQVVTLDLRDPALLSSPYYYMRHGDVLYVEPSGTRAANREVSSLQNLAISITSILITVVSLIVTLTK